MEILASRVLFRPADYQRSLTFYRDNCADIELTIDDVLAAPIAHSRALLISGTGLSREPSRSAQRLTPILHRFRTAH